MSERIVGTRTSQLALWQTVHVIELMKQAWPKISCRTEFILTRGDKELDKPLPQIGGKGLFTQELEQATLDGRIDLSVHSLKDLPVADSPGLTLGAIVGRADVRDVIVAKNGLTLDTLPAGSVIGTSSLRRQSQLLRQRPDLIVKSIRGNVDTRIRKVLDGPYDAAILAAAGVVRLGLEKFVTEWLSYEKMLPAPGQGALAVQCRADDAATLRLLKTLHQPDVAAAVTAERAFLQALGGGCATPVAALAEGNDDLLHLVGLVSSLDGTTVVRVTGSGDEPVLLAQRLAHDALSQGAAEILANV